MADLTISDRRWTDPVRERYAELMAASAARAANARERASSRLARKAGNALLWELPLHKLIRFRNPILQREVRGKFRWRSGSLATTVFQALLGLVPAGLYVTLLFAVFYPPERASTWWGVTGIGLTVFMLACAVMGASSITREREGGTWEGLHLSLLPPREIIAAKFAAPLIACFYYSLPLLPVLAFYINYNFALESNRAYGVPVLQAIATVFVVVGASAACTACGLFLSSLCTRTLTAVSWTLATLLLTLVLVPMLSSGIAYRPDAVMRWWQPYIALNEVRGNASSNEVGYQVFSLMVGARFLICMAVASLWLLTAASVVLRRQMRNVGLARDVATPSPTEAPQATG
jgi:ABC-type transport system involved in cytochrome c biogenesis permease component